MLQWIFSGGIGRKVVRAGPGVWERRRDYRLPCRFEATCQSGDRSVSAQLTEIGPRGLRMQSQTAFKPGTYLRISCRPGGMLIGRQRLPYKVTWCEPQEDGVALGVTLEDGSAESLTQTWVEYALKLLGALKRKMQPRRAFRAPYTACAQLRDVEGGLLGEAHLRDVGMQGAQIASPIFLEAGATLRFCLGPGRKLPALDVPARVLSTRRDRQTGERLAHLRFFGLNDAQSEMLERYVLAAIESMEADREAG